MSSRLIAILMKQAGQLARGGTSTADAELVARFVAGRDEAAFAALVQRHGPMVWAVCRNSLPTDADAEDAFQATFLALVRHAPRLRRADVVGSWLHAAAVRLCLTQRRTAQRRRAREARAGRPEAAHASDTLAWADELARAHDAIRQLPRREHAVFVLCVLEGASQAEAAAQLKLQVNSVSGLLARARRRLRGQVTSTGTLSVAALAVAASCPAAVPPTLLNLTYRLVGPATVLSRSVVSLSLSLTEFSMRKILFLAAVTMTLVGGATAGKFFVGAADAQDLRPAPKGTPAVHDRSEARGDPVHASSVAGPAQGWAGRGTAVPPSAAPPWEYKVLQPETGAPLEATLNQLGGQGWELCATSPHLNGFVTYIFKRPTQPRGDQAGRTVTSARTELRPTGPTTSAGVTLNSSAPLATTGVAVERAGTDYAVYKLRRGNATEVAEVLRRLFPSAIVTDLLRTNSILVEGAADEQGEIKRVIERLDLSAGSKP